jgi:transposase-like protein
MAGREKKEKDQRDRLLEQIDFHGMTQEEVLGQDGLIKQLTGRILQRALECEMDLHLGYKKHDPAGDNSGDSRNGHTSRTVQTENQEVVIQAPRDRAGTFEPQILLQAQG